MLTDLIPIAHTFNSSLTKSTSLLVHHERAIGNPIPSENDQQDKRESGRYTAPKETHAKI